MRAATRNGYTEGLERVVGYILANLDGGLEPRVLADRAGFSLYHFHRIFRGMMGESLGEFVRRLRLERAAARLLDGASVTETAFDAGYESHEAFTRAFREAFGVPPSGFRAKVYHLPNPTATHYWADGRPLLLRPLEGERTMNIDFREDLGRRVVAMEHRGPYWQIGPVFGKIGAWAGQNGVAHRSAVGIYYDNPEVTPLAELRSDAGLEVPKDFTSSDPEVHVVDLPAGQYAVGTYVGPYSGMGDAWGEFFRSLSETGREMECDPSFEVYLKHDEAAPENCVTELWQRVR